jgi:hypothetical protein
MHRPSHPAAVAVGGAVVELAHLTGKTQFRAAPFSMVKGVGQPDIELVALLITILVDVIVGVEHVIVDHVI